MSGEMLRCAAALMRERAKGATPGRWVPFGTSIGAEVQGCTCHGGIEPYGHEQYCGVEGPVVHAQEPDVEHIAPLATPAVALAVADLLEDAAENLDMQAPSGACRKHWDIRVHIAGEKALAVARAYLGSES